MDNDPITDNQLLRYARHILLPQVGVEGQERLLRARVLIVGLGGLGTPAAIYLATSGVGHLTLADGDHVDRSNLPRQILYDESCIGLPKTECAATSLRRLNSDIDLTLIRTRLEGSALQNAVTASDLVLDASDNFDTRFAVNKACVAACRPLVSGAVIRMEGQITVFRRDLPQSPCYRCLYGEGADDETCVENGVLAPIAGIIGLLQATEAIKILAGLGNDLAGRLLLFDGLRTSWREITLRRDPGCPVCGKETPADNGTVGAAG